MQIPVHSTVAAIEPPLAPPVTVIDSIMGSGKTTYALKMMQDTWSQDTGRRFICPEGFMLTKFLYIAPTLDEVERIKDALPDLRFRDPIPINGRKAEHLRELIEERQNIVSTHALFQLLTSEVFELLRDESYVLIIDEALECVRPFSLSSGDRRLLRGGLRPLTYVDDQKRLRWNYDIEPDYAGRFNDIKNLCDNGNLVAHRDRFLLWEFPSEFLEVFSRVYILTYLFEGSPMSSHLRAAGLHYRRCGLQDGELLLVEEIDDAAVRQRLRELITVVDDQKLNAVGSPKLREHPLSATWFDRERKKGSPEDLRRLQLSTAEFFRRHAKTPARDNLWTTFKKVRNDLKGGGYARAFIPVNCKATNDHIEKKSLAYLANVFYRPDVAGYFRDRGVAFDEDLHALSEMLQWIWRSQIRRWDPITVYIPSQRMRELLQRWLLEGAEGIAKKVCEVSQIRTSQIERKCPFSQ